MDHVDCLRVGRQASSAKGGLAIDEVTLSNR